MESFFHIFLTQNMAHTTNNRRKQKQQQQQQKEKPTKKTKKNQQQQQQKAQTMETFKSQPGVPGGIHPAEVVQAVCSCYQSVDFALPSLKLSEVVKARHDGSHGFLNQGNQLLAVHVLGLPSC